MKWSSIGPAFFQRHHRFTSSPSSNGASAGSSRPRRRCRAARCPCGRRSRGPSPRPRFDVRGGVPRMLICVAGFASACPAAARPSPRRRRGGAARASAPRRRRRGAPADGARGTRCACAGGSAHVSIAEHPHLLLGSRSTPPPGRSEG